MNSSTFEPRPCVNSKINELTLTGKLDVSFYVPLPYDMVTKQPPCTFGQNPAVDVRAELERQRTEQYAKWQITVNGCRELDSYFVSAMQRIANSSVYDTIWTQKVTPQDRLLPSLRERR